jgi:hypothetical protein
MSDVELSVSPCSQHPPCLARAPAEFLQLGAVALRRVPPLPPQHLLPGPCTPSLPAQPQFHSERGYLSGVRSKAVDPFSARLRTHMERLRRTERFGSR